MALRLDLVPILMSDRIPLLDRLVGRLGELLRVDVRRREPLFDPITAFDSSRGQYSSTDLLRQLLDGAPEDADLVLGVTGVDLFVPVLTYVFGEAQLDGKVAVVSLNRLAPDAYGLPSDEELLFTRLLTEAIHELGHCFGLLHCGHATCVMRSSTYVEEIDLKRPLFCDSCAARLPGDRPAVDIPRTQFDRTG